MTAPDRPTREQVDAALARAERRYALDERTLAAEVRALRADVETFTKACDEYRADLAVKTGQLNAARRTALVARTPQPADPADTAKVGDRLGLAWADAQDSVMDEGCNARSTTFPEAWICTRSAHYPGRQHVATIGGKVVAVWPSGPLPAVPDGEGTQDLRDQLDRAHALNRKQHRELVQLTMVPPLPFGEDVPARLDAAADAFAMTTDAEFYRGAEHLRSIAEELRNVGPDVRAAVAAALALPTEQQR